MLLPKNKLGPLLGVKSHQAIHCVRNEGYPLHRVCVCSILYALHRVCVCVFYFIRVRVRAAPIPIATEVLFALSDVYWRSTNKRVSL